MTTSIRQGPEAAAQAIAATLAAYLPGCIADVWTAWSGYVPTNETAPPQPTIAHYLTFRRDLIADYPVVVVSPAPGSQQTANHATTPSVAGAAYDIERHRLYVEVGCISGNVYELETTCTRLVWAIRTCLLKHMALDGDSSTLLGGYAGSLTIGTFGVGQAVDEATGYAKQFQQWGGVEVLLDVLEAVI